MEMLIYHQGEEVLHLPVIVESAESSPQAAAKCASVIRKFLTKDYAVQPHRQYNAIMLISILSNNPGQSFTRNFNGKFVSTVRDLLRMSRDPSVQQILRETLRTLEHEKAYDTNLNTLFAMWRKEKGGNPAPIPSAWYEQGIHHGHQHQILLSQQQHIQRYYERQNWHNHHQSHNSHLIGPDGEYTSRSRGFKRSKMLPPQHELVNRIEESRTVAKLLMQVVQSTSTADLSNNGLAREFAERAQSAQRSIQGYINCENPAPDDNTLQTLVDTNDQLSLALSRHQRAILKARRSTGQYAGTGANENTSAALPSQQEHPNGYHMEQQQQQWQNSVTGSNVLTHEQRYYKPAESAAAPLSSPFASAPTGTALNAGGTVNSGTQNPTSFRGLSNSTITKNNNGDDDNTIQGRLTSFFSSNNPSLYPNNYGNNPSTVNDPSTSTDTPSSTLDYLSYSDQSQATAVTNTAYAPPAPIAPLRVRKASKESNSITNSPNSTKTGNYSPKSNSSVPDTTVATTPSRTNGVKPSPPSSAATAVMTSFNNNNVVVSPSSIDRSELVSPIQPYTPSQLYSSKTGEDPFSDENAVSTSAAAPTMPLRAAPVPVHVPAPAPSTAAGVVVGGGAGGVDGLRRKVMGAVESNSGGSANNGGIGAIPVSGNAFVNRNGSGTGSRNVFAGKSPNRNGNMDEQGNETVLSEEDRYGIVSPIEDVTGGTMSRY